MSKHMPIFGLRLIGINTGSAHLLGIESRVCKQLGIDVTQEVSQFVFEPITGDRMRVFPSIDQLRETVEKISIDYGEGIPLFSQQGCSWIKGPVTTKVLLSMASKTKTISSLTYLHLVVHLALSYCLIYGKDSNRHLMEMIYWEKTLKHKLVLVFNMPVDIARVSNELAQAARQIKHHFQGGAIK